MQVDPQKAAAKSEYEGKTYYFCAPGCKKKFDTSPAQYLAPKLQPLTQLSANLTKPPAASPPAATATRPAEYTCPMHPEVRQFGPGACPKCGMALEPLEITGEEVNPELEDMKRRFSISIALTVPLLILMVIEMFPHPAGRNWTASLLSGWIQFALATPVVVWGGLPFFERGWASVISRNWNMFTLISLGTGVAYLFSVAALLFPSAIPGAFRGQGGMLPLVLRTGRRDHHARVARAGSRIARALANQQRTEGSFEPRSQDRAPHCRWAGARRSP